MGEQRQMEETQVTSTSEATEPKPKQDQPAYETRSWSGLPQYVCRKCGFDTLKLRVIRRHVKEGCRQKPGPSKRARRHHKPPRVVLRRTEKE